MYTVFGRLRRPSPRTVGGSGAVAARAGGVGGGSGPVVARVGDVDSNFSWLFRL